MSLHEYIDGFRQLNVNRARGHSSPHKVCMLLAVMDLIESGAITDNHIEFNEAVTEKFAHHVEMIGSAADRVTPYLPFYHLKSEGFWHHEVMPGKEAAYQNLSRSNSERGIREAIAFAWVDDELFDFLRYSVTREQLKSALFENLDEERRTDLHGALSGWSQLECELITRDYLDMLVEELNGRNYSKAEHRRRLQPHLDERSDGSIEYKHQNISAILIELGLPYLRGYKPAFNYQRLLAEVVAVQVETRQLQLLQGTDHLIEELPHRVMGAEFDEILEAPPERERTEAREDRRPYVARHFNYAAREAHNRRLGGKGEEFVLALEKQRLLRLGREDLSKEVEWTSKERGDGAGYDIRSFSGDSDRELFIEVKTTNSGKYQPFMITDNEVAFSDEHSNQYSLYRLFQFKDSPRLFTLDGSIREHVNLLVRDYTATFK